MPFVNISEKRIINRPLLGISIHHKGVLPKANTLPWPIAACTARSPRVKLMPREGLIPFALASRQPLLPLCNKDLEKRHQSHHLIKRYFVANWTRFAQKPAAAQTQDCKQGNTYILHQGNNICPFVELWKHGYALSPHNSARWKFTSLSLAWMRSCKSG